MRVHRPSSLTPKKTLPLNLDDPAHWQKSIAGHGTMEITAGSEGGVRLRFTFASDGDNWAYPRVSFTPEMDLSAYDGVRFEYRTDTAEPGPVRMFLFEPTGAAISQTPACQVAPSGRPQRSCSRSWATCLRHPRTRTANST